MKIHTTQNLSSLVNEKSTNNAVISNEIRLNSLRNFNELSYLENTVNDSISFKKKKPSSKDVKKFLDSIKKGVGEVAKDAHPEVKKGDKFRKSPLFNWALNVSDYETVMTATIAAFACALRAATLMGMAKFDEKNKENNIYAIAHALASGIVGFITVFLLTAPFKAGSDYVLKNMFKDLKVSTLKRLHPQLDDKSILDKAGNRVAETIKETINGKEVEKVVWKNYIDGKDFCKEVKNCDMLAQFKHISEMSEESFNKLLGVDVDWVAQKGKSFNEVLTKNGKKLYDEINMSYLGIKIKHIENSAKSGKEIKTTGQILLKDIDKNYLKDLIEKAEEKSLFKDLDINSVFDGSNVRDFRQWKKVGSKEQWKLDLDSIYVSSPLETADYAPRITGRMRFDEKEGVHKFRTYQRNGKEVEGSIIKELGTEISDDMLRAEKESAGLLKCLTWLPDLLFRVPIAATTIALIPAILKNVFHLEKKKPQADKQEDSVKPQEQNININKSESAPAFKGARNIPQDVDGNNAPAFKGGPSKNPSWIKKQFQKLTNIIAKFMGELYGKRLIENDGMAKASAKLSDVPGGLTQAMSTFGSLITSGVYVQRTLSNKDLDPEKRNTLAINQTLCFVVPTIAAYIVDKLINEKVKKFEYRLSGQKQQEAAKALLNNNKEKADKILSGLNKNIKGVRILASLSVFTLIYRYATPVLITPFANKIGNWLNAKNNSKKEVLSSSKAA